MTMARHGWNENDRRWDEDWRSGAPDASGPDAAGPDTWPPVGPPTMPPWGWRRRHADAPYRHDVYEAGWRGGPHYGEGGGDRRHGGVGYGGAGYGRGGRASGYGGDYDRHDEDRGFLTRAVDEVASWFGDDDAERRRDRDRRSERRSGGLRGRGPRGYRRSDERISADVHRALSDDHELDATDIEVRVSDGEVTLDGTVASRFAKRRAEDCADDVAGVDHVQNNLRVRSDHPPLPGLMPS
jgi:osmotically-inducible protein OsmY